MSLRKDLTVLAAFLAPLAFTNVAVDIGEQVLNRTLSKGKNAVATLAGFGLAYTLMKFFTGPLQEAKHLGLVLVVDHGSRKRATALVVCGGLLTAVFLAAMGWTRLGVWVIEDLHGVDAETGRAAYESLLSLSVYPLLDGMSYLYAGTLLRQGRSAIVGTASLSDIAAQVVTAASLIHTPLICQRPLVVPVLAAYFGVVVRLTINLVAYWKKVRCVLPVMAENSAGVRRMIFFLWPLWLVMFMQRLSRPLVNLLVARSMMDSGKKAADRAVAILSVTYPVAHLPYGWLNEIRAVSPTFRRHRDDRLPMSGRTVSRFALLCFCTSAAAMIILFWLPGVAEAVLTSVNGISGDLAAGCVAPLHIFSFFPVPVSLRAHLTGWLTLRQQTKAVAPSAPMRIVVITAMLFVLPALGVRGATMGIAALFSGFLIESLLVLAGTLWVRRRWRRRRRGGRQSLKESGQDASLANSGDLTDQTAASETVALVPTGVTNGDDAAAIVDDVYLKLRTASTHSAPHQEEEEEEVEL